jgi:hypothetical protein
VASHAIGRLQTSPPDDFSPGGVVLRCDLVSRGGFVSGILADELFSLTASEVSHVVARWVCRLDCLLVRALRVAARRSFC